MRRNLCNLLVAAISVAIVCANNVEAGETPAAGKATQPLVGEWLGTLKVGAVSLRLEVEVTAKPDGTYAGTLNSLDQDGVARPVDEVSLKGKKVHIVFKTFGLEIDGTLNEAGTEIAGKFKQGGAALPIVFKKQPASAANGPEEAKGAGKGSGPLVGNWLGTLKVGAIGLRLAVAVTAKVDGTYAGTLNSLDQDAVARRLDEVTLKDKTVHLALKAFKLEIDGTLNEAGTEIAGKFKQGGVSFPIVFKKSDKPPAPRKRPQQPKPPYPYRSEEVTYENKAGHAKLAGTLTVPKGEGRFPAVLLITGSGPQNRDEEIFGHRPFLVLADYLTRHGIAVLRVDDRGVGKSTGDIRGATSEDFAGDVEAGVAYLRSRPEVDPAKIGLIGHSEGGLIAPMVANRTHDVAFIVLLAGPGLPGDQILRMQLEFLLKESGASDSLVARTVDYQKKLCAAVYAEHDPAALEKKMKELRAEYVATLTPAEKKLANAEEDVTDRSAKTLGSPWFRFFMAYDPRPALSQVKCPVLALIGAKDMQVPAKENIPELEKALKAGGNKDFTVRELPHLNHLFQTCENGSVTEYAKIEETFAPAALEAIGKWIAEHTSTDSRGAHAARQP